MTVKTTQCYIKTFQAWMFVLSTMV